MKLLVLGCGSIGKRHANNFASLADVAVYDRNPEATKNLTLPSFETLEAGLAWQPDAVIVSTPHDTHLAMAARAVEGGAHVLVEKPISNTLEGVARVIALASAQAKKLYVVCNMRFYSGVVVMKEQMARIGRPLFARAHYGNYLPNMRPNTDYRNLYAANRSQGGGVILDAIHEFDYLRWFFGPIESLIAKAGKLSELAIDVEDYAAIQLGHKNGVQTEIHLDYLQRCKRRGCEIVGTQGTLIWNSIGKNPEHCQVRLYTEKNGVWETLYDNKNESINKAYQTLAKKFVAALSSNNVTDLASGEDGFHTLRVALSALESANKGQRATLKKIELL